MRVSAAGWLALATAPIFCVLAIANSAGYRYGVSDLAFYLPAAFRHIDPALFPRDGAMLDVQARLTLADEFLAGMVRVGRVTGLSDPQTVYLAHLGTLLLLFVAAVLLARCLFRSAWGTGAFAVALTLRHGVANGGVNTLEGYFHPRVAAFALCVLALAAFLRRGPWLAILVGLVACAIHTTTGFWILILVGVGGLVSDRRNRLALATLGGVAALLFAYALVRGPLADRLQPMDAAWQAALADKAYLFPDRWPPDAWLVCAVYVAAIVVATLRRRREGSLTCRERGMLAGAASLLIIFLVVLPLLLARSALAVQLQPARVFWFMDLLAIVAVVWLAESFDKPGRPVTAVLATVLLITSIARGVYLMEVRFPERTMFQAATPDSPWQQVMRWAQATGKGSHWLAHPNHAFLYGSSLRVSGMRDVFLEGTKDPAMAMYDRRIAMEVTERLRLISNFDGLTADEVHALAQRYGLDFMVTETALPLPIAYSRPPLIVYDLRPGVVR
jgi:hypothetical protein